MKDIMYIYNEKENDETKEIILKEEKKRGFEHTKPLVFDDSYVDLYNDLVYNLKGLIDESTFKYENVNPHYIKNSIKLWRKFGIRLQPVLHISNFDSDEKNTLEMFQKTSKVLKVSKIPIEITNVENNEIISYIDEIDLGVNDYIFTFINKIVISNINNNISSCIYNHEVTHTQQQYNKDYSKCMLDDETLPIFFEELFAYTLDNSLETLSQIRTRRLIYLFEHFYDMFFKRKNSYKDVIMMDMYIKSSLQAINMFNIYLSKNSKIQKEMLRDIKKIFEYEKTLLDVLYKYESELSMVDKDFNKLKKIKY